MAMRPSVYEVGRVPIRMIAFDRCKPPGRSSHAFESNPGKFASSLLANSELEWIKRNQLRFALDRMSEPLDFTREHAFAAAL
jgi:hypothetical protein